MDSIDKQGRSVETGCSFSPMVGPKSTMVMVFGRCSIGARGMTVVVDMNDSSVLCAHFMLSERFAKELAQPSDEKQHRQTDPEVLPPCGSAKERHEAGSLASRREKFEPKRGDVSRIVHRVRDIGSDATGAVRVGR